MQFSCVDNAEIVKLLIKSGANVDALDYEGKSAFNAARDSGVSVKWIPDRLVFESRVEETHLSNWLYVILGNFGIANLLRDTIITVPDNRSDCIALHEAVSKGVMDKNDPNHVELILNAKLFIIWFR